jgi:hypothetical protein
MIKLIVMKKLALVLTFVFSVAILAPAFAADPPQKPAAKTECAKTCAKEGTAACSKAGAATADQKATCPKASATCPKATAKSTSKPTAPAKKVN